MCNITKNTVSSNEKMAYKLQFEREIADIGMGLKGDDDTARCTICTVTSSRLGTVWFGLLREMFRMFLLGSVKYVLHVLYVGLYYAPYVFYYAPYK